MPFGDRRKCRIRMQYKALKQRNKSGKWITVTYSKNKEDSSKWLFFDTIHIDELDNYKQKYNKVEVHIG